MHIFNMPVTFNVWSFMQIAWKLWEELITQTCYPTLNLGVTDVQTDGQGQKIMIPDFCHGA